MRRFALGFAVASALVTSPAAAQVHWDGEVLAGAQKRFLSQKPPGGDDAGFGPAIALQGHFALFPLLRVGAYARGELSPQGDAPARRMLAGGAQLKITPPWPRGNWRMWATLGVGYVGVYAPSYTTSLFPPNGGAQRPVVVDGAGGGFLEIPIALGVSYKLRKPWILLFQLDTRFGAGFSGSLYGGGGGGRSVLDPAFFDQAVVKAGNDLFSLGLSVGVGFDL